MQISKRNLASLYMALYNNRKVIALKQPPENDNVFKYLLHIKPAEIK